MKPSKSIGIRVARGDGNRSGVSRIQSCWLNLYRPPRYGADQPSDGGEHVRANATLTAIARHCNDEVSMDELVLPITRTGRKYGYITWKKVHDAELKALLGTSESIELLIEDVTLPNRNVDWKNRRISITKRQTRCMPELAEWYVLNRTRDRKLRLQFEKT